jgi:hypothetical protein
MAYVILLLLLLAVVWVVSAPLRRRPGGGSAAGESLQSAPDAMQRIDLEAARDAKFREIRDAELDHQTGKLSDEDFAAIDSTLRAEAVELLHRLDATSEPAEPVDDP